MEYMPEFEILKPVSLTHAVAIRSDDPNAAFIAGGTDLVPNMRRGIAQPEKVIDLSGITEIRSIERRNDGLRIGAAVTLSELIADQAVKESYAAIAEAAGTIAASTHREVATVGGNLCLDTRCVFYNQSEWWRRSNSYCLKSRGEICHVAPKGDHCFAAFSGDLPPALMIYDAEVEIASPSGSHTIPLIEMYRDDGRDHLALEPDEMLVAVVLPAPPDGFRTTYSKSRVRGAIEFPLAGVAIGMCQYGINISNLRIAFTGTNSMPIIVDGCDALNGKSLDDELLEEFLKQIPKQIQPMTSTFTPPGYRRRVVTNLVRSLLQKLYRG